MADEGARFGLIAKLLGAQKRDRSDDLSSSAPNAEEPEPLPTKSEPKFELVCDSYNLTDPHDLGDVHDNPGLSCGSCSCGSCGSSCGSCASCACGGRDDPYEYC